MTERDWNTAMEAHAAGEAAAKATRWAKTSAGMSAIALFAVIVMLLLR